MAADPNDATNYDDCGFDIFHGDTPLDFNLLGTEGGRKFCILKVTEGHTVKDATFGNHVTALIPTNIKRLGAYHFAHHGDPDGQMKIFIDTFKAAVQGIPNKPKFLFMLDLEVNPGDPNPPQEDDGIAMVRHLQAQGINPLIYCGKDFWSQSFPELKSCPHYLAAYNDHPISAVPWRVPGADTFGWDMWQYTDGAQGPFAKHIPGAPHDMDLSCFNLKKHPGGLAAWWDDQLTKNTQP
jgi:GH25 family lysozyme M1 (1,4-beta-N-acetylmuramidase)